MSPTRPPAACPRHPCKNAQPCPVHAPASWSAGQRGRRMPPGWTSSTVPRILARDGHRCRGCGAPAVIVDHADRFGGDDDANLQSLCQSCSDAKTQREAQAARRDMLPARAAAIPFEFDPRQDHPR